MIATVEVTVFCCGSLDDGVGVLNGMKRSY